jgi:hypothetical protein
LGLVILCNNGDNVVDIVWIEMKKEKCFIFIFILSFVIATKETKNLGKTMLLSSPEYIKNHSQSCV